MKLLAGMALFLLCALWGEGKARRLQRREQTLARLHDLLRDVGDRQLTGLVPFREAVLRCSPSPERALLLDLLEDRETSLPLLTTEEAARLKAYARSESRSVTALRGELDALLSLLQGERERTRAEHRGRGQVYRSVGYLFGVAALLLVL